MWKHLKAKALSGRKFRRKHSINNFILDFYCPQERLVVEIDGRGDDDVVYLNYCLEKDLFLKEIGITVLRFSDAEIFDQMDLILMEIESHFNI